MRARAGPRSYTRSFVRLSSGRAHSGWDIENCGIRDSLFFFFFPLFSPSIKSAMCNLDLSGMCIRILNERRKAEYRDFNLRLIRKGSPSRFEALYFDELSVSQELGRKRNGSCARRKVESTRYRRWNRSLWNRARETLRMRRLIISSLVSLADNGLTLSAAPSLLRFAGKGVLRSRTRSVCELIGVSKPVVGVSRSFNS